MRSPQYESFNGPYTARPGDGEPEPIGGAQNSCEGAYDGPDVGVDEGRRIRSILVASVSDQWRQEPRRRERSVTSWTRPRRQP